MPARKKQEDEINLLPQKGFQTSTTGRVLAWILSTFRIIVIVTEMIVMIAFLSRFWFDAQNSDLNEKILHKQAALSALIDFERKFKDVQKRLAIYSSSTKREISNTEVLNLIKNSLPSDVILASITLEKDKIKITGITPSEKSMQQLIVNLSSNQKKFTDVNLTEAGTKPDDPSFILFGIDIKLGSVSVNNT